MPAAVLPAPPNCAPSTLTNISAMKLSDGWFISRSSSVTGWERHSVTSAASLGVRPRRALRETFDAERRAAASRTRVAAKFAGRFCQYGARRPVRPRLNVSAESGPTSDVSAEARGRHAAAGVERRLVADHAARDAHDPGVGDLLGEPVGVEHVERRVAAAAQVQVAGDDAGGVGRGLGQHARWRGGRSAPMRRSVVADV